MAKRRNLKKEKQLRNEAYARKFRKRSGRRGYRRFYQSNQQDSNNNENEQGGSSAATDTSAAS
ncbi:MAG: hypothetical protein AAGF24_15240 [Cyanobacteria bacterium P01_H01_bin.121]